MMNAETELYDPAGENKPQKTMNPKTKKLLIYLLCVVIGVALAAGLIWLFDALFSGAATPEEAVAEYQKASLLYDIDGMIEYSSDYNKTVLYGNRETSDRLLSAYLKKAYEEFKPQHTEDEISFQLVSVLEYEPGEAKFDEIMQTYTQKDANGTEEIEKIAIVRMTVVTGSNDTTRDYLVIKKGFRWYYGYAGV